MRGVEATYLISRVSFIAMNKMAPLDNTSIDRAQFDAFVDMKYRTAAQALSLRNTSGISRTSYDIASFGSET